jgi:hypothetical protein
MKDLRIELKLKNAVLYNALRERYSHLVGKNEGFIIHVAKEIGVQATELCHLLNLKKSPWKKKKMVSLEGQCFTIVDGPPNASRRFIS